MSKLNPSDSLPTSPLPEREDDTVGKTVYSASDHRLLNLIVFGFVGMMLLLVAVEYLRTH